MLQALGVRNAHAAKLAAPLVKGGIGKTVLPIYPLSLPLLLLDAKDR